MSSRTDDRSTLVLGPAIPASGATACLDVEHDADREVPLGVVHVDYVRSPERRIRRWTDRATPTPHRVGLLRVGWRGQGHSSVERLAETEGLRLRFEPIQEPGNLSAIGRGLIRLLEWLDESPIRIVVCVHSLSVALQYASTQRLLDFLSECREQFRRYGASAHFHLDPDAHSDETVDRLYDAFDDGSVFRASIPDQ